MQGLLASAKTQATKRGEREEEGEKEEIENQIKQAVDHGNNG